MAEDVDILVQQALAIEDLDDDERWRIVRQLHARRDRHGFDAACLLASAETDHERILGIDILAQFGAAPADSPTTESQTTSHPYLAETLPIVLAALDDDNVEILVSAITAAAHLGDDSLLGAVLGHGRHPSEHVRLNVAFALASVAGDPPAAQAVVELIRLSSDVDPEVRDWATFAIGTLLKEIDSEPVRDALAARLDDPEGDSAGEALVGLARRRDGRALAPLLARLDDHPGNLVIEAAAELSALEALPVLLLLKQQGWPGNDRDADLLEEAIRRASAQAGDDLEQRANNDG